MKIWLDDERPMPECFDTHCRTVEDAKEKIAFGGVTHISLDNDLGIGYTEGYKLAEWIECWAFNGGYRFHLAVHTANPEARRRICMALQNTEKYWDNHGIR